MERSITADDGRDHHSPRSGGGKKKNTYWQNVKNRKKEQRQDQHGVKPSRRASSVPSVTASGLSKLPRKLAHTCIQEYFGNCVLLLSYTLSLWVDQPGTFFDICGKLVFLYYLRARCHKEKVVINLGMFDLVPVFGVKTRYYSDYQMCVSYHPEAEFLTGFQLIRDRVADVKRGLKGANFAAFVDRAINDIFDAWTRGEIALPAVCFRWSQPYYTPLKPWSPVWARVNTAGVGKERVMSAVTHEQFIANVPLVCESFIIRSRPTCVRQYPVFLQVAFKSLVYAACIEQYLALGPSSLSDIANFYTAKTLPDTNSEQSLFAATHAVDVSQQRINTLCVSQGEDPIGFDVFRVVSPISFSCIALQNGELSYQNLIEYYMRMYFGSANAHAAFFRAVPPGTEPKAINVLGDRTADELSAMVINTKGIVASGGDEVGIEELANEYPEDAKKEDNLEVALRKDVDLNDLIPRRPVIHMASVDHVTRLYHVQALAQSNMMPVSIEITDRDTFRRAMSASLDRAANSQFVRTTTELIQSASKRSELLLS